MRQDDVNKNVPGSNGGASLNVEMSVMSPTIEAGKPVPMVFTVTNGQNGSMVTHPDMQLTIKGAGLVASDSEPKGGMMAMEGAYHGHTGVMNVVQTFPSPGHYFLFVHLSSLPVSNYMFGTADTMFHIHVNEPSNLTGRTVQTAATTPTVPNTVNILGVESPFFTPNSLNIKVGTTVTFVNTDGNIHTVTSVTAGTQTPDGIFDSGMVKPGNTFSYTFSKSGTYEYICTIHPHMHGTITVS